MQVVYVDFKKQEIQNVKNFDYGKDGNDYGDVNSITITVNGDLFNHKMPYEILRILGKILKDDFDNTKKE